MLVSGFPPAHAAVTGVPAWDWVAAASPGTDARLLDVAKVGGTVWAVGNARPDPLVVRWNGTAFVRMAIPALASRNDVLEGVDGSGSGDVWAVGHADRLDVVGSLSRAYHWNGTNWQLVPTPNSGGSGTINDLLAVTVISSNDAWAVGRVADFSTSHALTLHWNGASWRRVSNPCGHVLNGVAALSATNVWAVGGNTLCRWNGSRWTAQTAPQIPGRLMDLQDVDGLPGALWAVGLEAAPCGEGLCSSGIVLRRTSSGWVREVEGFGLRGISVVSSTEAWAVGSWAFGPLLLHRDSTGWRPAPTPDTPGVGGLEAVDARGSGADWAVGKQFASGASETLALIAPSPRSGAVEGQSSSNAAVTWVGPESGSIDADQFGHFQVGGLTAGSYTFIAAQQGCEPAVRSLSITAGTTEAVTLLPACP